jgi:hypothetical protein
MIRRTLATLLIGAACAAAPAHAAPDPAQEAPDPASQKLGDAYAQAGPADRLVLISVASAEKVLAPKETTQSIAAVTRAEVDRGASPKERLELLGKLRKDAQEKLKAVNKQRKSEKKSFASFREPESYYQQALALAYLAAEAGPQPTLEKLGALALVRECTNWSAHHQLVLAAVTDAFARDAEFMGKDVPGKLAIIKTHAEERGIMSDQERTYVERSVIGDWLSAQLAAGRPVAEIAAEVKQLRNRKQVCFFTASWADGILKRLADFPRAKATPAGPQDGEAAQPKDGEAAQPKDGEAAKPAGADQ